MPISVASAQDFFFEVSDVSDNAFTFVDSSATNFQITVNRVNQSNGTNDFVSSKFLTANSDGSLPKTQVKIDIPAGTTDHNAYFDASFSVVVTSFNSSMVVVRSEHKLAKYILPPSASTINNVVVATQEARILITADLADASFNKAGLKYLIQIDGPSNTAGSNYVSRNYYVDASYGNLSFDSSGVIDQDDDNVRIVNNKRYDIAVVAFNATGSVAVSEHTSNILVSEHANAPSVTVTNLFNSSSSTGQFTLTIQSDNAVDNDADRKYQIKVISVDTSNVEVDREIAASKDASNNFDNSYVTFEVTNLTANKEYIVEVKAANSTNVFSEAQTAMVSGSTLIRPEALPSGLEITEIRTGLLADQLDPSGKLLVRLNKDGFSPNGLDVSLIYHVDRVDTGLQAATILSNLKDSPDDSGVVNYKLPFYDVNDDLISNAFEISGLENNANYLVAVYAQNNATALGASDLSASWTALNNTNTAALLQAATLATNTPAPATHPSKPSFLETSPLDGSNAVALGLNSGEIKAVIQLPTDTSGGNVANYTAYRIFLEDVSGVDIAGKTTGTDSAPFVSITQSQYLVMGTRFTSSVDGSFVIVSQDPRYSQGLKQHDFIVDSSNTPTYVSYVNDASWSASSTQEIWLNAAGKTVMNADASFSKLFTGLTDGDLHRVKAQVKVGSLESSILAEQKDLKPSSKPLLDGSNLSNKVAGIFDVQQNKTLLDGNHVSFSATGLKELLVGSTDGGYPITDFLVSFVSSETVLGAVNYTIDQQYMVDASDSIIDASYTNASLVGGKEYSVHVVPQNDVYNDVSFTDFLTDLSGVDGKIVLGEIKLDSQILDTSGNPSFDISGANNDEILITGQLVQGNGNTTAFVQIDGTLTSKPKKWNGSSFASLTPAEEASFNYVETFTLLPDTSAVDASGFFTKSLTVPKKRYGWNNQVTLNVISRPKDSQVGSSVTYSAPVKDSSSLGDEIKIGKKPTIILEDSSKVIVIPNGKTTTVELIDLSGNEIATITPFDPGMNVKFNTFVDASNTIVAIDSDAVEDQTIPVMDLSFGASGINNTFQLNEDKTLQASAFNEHGRTTLLSEKTFTLTSITGATLVASPNDGRFVLQPTTTGQISFKLDIA